MSNTLTDTIEIRRQAGTTQLPGPSTGIRVVETLAVAGIGALIGVLAFAGIGALIGVLAVIGTEVSFGLYPRVVALQLAAVGLVGVGLVAFVAWTARRTANQLVRRTVTTARRVATDLHTLLDRNRNATEANRHAIRRLAEDLGALAGEREQTGARLDRAENTLRCVQGTLGRIQRDQVELSADVRRLRREMTRPGPLAAEVAVLKSEIARQRGQMNIALRDLAELVGKIERRMAADIMAVYDLGGQAAQDPRSWGGRGGIGPPNRHE